MPAGQNSFITDPTNNVATIAPLGNVFTNEAFPIIIASYHQSITAASGGTNLANIPCGKVEIQNLSGNGVMWIGGVDQSAPYSGRGNELMPMNAGMGLGEKTMYVTNTNQISVCAFFSGQLISFIAYGNRQVVNADPATQGTAPNLTPPMVSGTTPLSGSTNMPANQAIVWTFNEAMDVNNISGLYVVTSGQASPQSIGHLGGTLVYNSGDNFATFQPNSGQYQLSGWYIPMADPTVEGFNGIALSGGITFSGGPFQIQGPPEVSGFVPLSGTNNCSGNQTVLITFSQPMLSGTINISGIYLVTSGTTSPHISGTVTPVAGSPTQAQFTPISGAIATASWYIPFVTTNCTDLYGDHILSLVSGDCFQTAAVFGPDTTPPNVSTTSPVSGATDVLVMPIPAIQIVMSEPVQPATITQGTVRVHDIQGGDTNIAGTVSLQSDQVTIDWKPNSNFANSHLHRMEISGIKDLPGNLMVPFSGATFTTEVAFQISGTTPISGTTGVDIGVTFQVSLDRQADPAYVNTNTVGLLDVAAGNSRLAGAVSLTSDKITVAFKPTASLGYQSDYNIDVSGIADVNDQQFIVPSSGTIFTTVAPPLTQVYNVGSGSATVDPLCAGTGSNVQRTGEHIKGTSSPLYNRKIKQAQFIMRKVGSPTGTLSCVVRDSSDSILTTLGTIDVSTISTGYTPYQFTNLSASSATDSSSRIQVEYGGGNSSNRIDVIFNTGNHYTSTDGADYQGGFGYADSNGQYDVCGIFWY